MLAELMSPVSENVKRLRKAAGLTQQQLAVAAGLSVSIVSQIEQGTTPDPRGSTLAALAGVLQAAVDELLRPAPAVVEEKPAAPKSRRKKKG
jgi:transcriptional regulator with XRE-family HTH domain